MNMENDEYSQPDAPDEVFSESGGKKPDRTARARYRRWYLAHPEKHAANVRGWVAKNRIKWNNYMADRMRRKRKEIYQKRLWNDI